MDNTTISYLNHNRLCLIKFDSLLDELTEIDSTAVNNIACDLHTCYIELLECLDNYDSLFSDINAKEQELVKMLALSNGTDNIEKIAKENINLKKENDNLRNKIMHLELKNRHLELK